MQIPTINVNAPSPMVRPKSMMASRAPSPEATSAVMAKGLLA